MGLDALRIGKRPLRPCAVRSGGARAVATVMAALALACADACACLQDGPPLPRTFYHVVLDDSLPASLELVTLDLLELALPAGQPEAWRWSVRESAPGRLRWLSAQELAGVLDSRQVHTTEAGAGVAGLPGRYLGMLRAGTVDIEVHHPAQQRRYRLQLKIADHPPRPAAPAAPRSGGGLTIAVQC